MSIYDVFSGGNRPFDKEEWAAAKQAQRKEAYELIDNTCSEMVASGDSFRQYLDVQGRFDRYSVANAILVSAQMPEATQLSKNSQDVIDLLTKASRHYQQTILMITHNNGLTSMVDRVLRVTDGVLTDLGGNANEKLS